MAPPPIPLEVLFGGGTAREPHLSPSGGRLAYLAPGADGAANIWVADAGRAASCGAAAAAGMPGARAVTHDPRGIGIFRWAGDDRFLTYATDGNGDERTHVHVIDLLAGTDRDITPFPGVSAAVVAVRADVPGTFLVGMDRRAPGMMDVYRAGPVTGTLTRVAENFGVTGWLADRGLRVRAAVAPREDGGADLMVRDAEDAPWRTVYRVDHGDTAALAPVGFAGGEDRELIVASSKDAQASRLLRLDLGTGATRVVYEDPRRHDVAGVHLDPGTGRPRIAVVQRERRDLQALDPAVAGDVAWLRDRCRGDVSLLDHDRADRRWLVQDLTDDGPAAYLLFDRAARRLRYLYSRQRDLSGYRLARMEPFSLTARDGLTLHGYLTYPPGRPRRDLPTVLAVHGGPWSRDVWGLRAEPQWLANRGYLCVNVNFRGSTGYGKEFADAGDREWGGRMQDDLVDTIRHLVGRRIADPGRLAIYGRSYGGYAALAGAAFTPDLFRCAIAAAAPSDLRTFIGAIPAAWRLAAADLYRRVGHPVADAGFLWSRSPLSRAGDVRIPVLIAQGANDPRVRRQESEQFVAALRERGVPHEYLLFDDEGHGLIRPRNRLAFYRAAERFLAAHLGGSSCG